MKTSSDIHNPSLHSSLKKQKTFPSNKLMKKKEKIDGNGTWVVEAPQERGKDRYPLMREIPYSYSIVREKKQSKSQATYIADVEEKLGSALSLNLHSGGMLLIMDENVEVSQVLKLGIPTPLTDIHTPTLAEIRWVKSTPFTCQSSTCFVGVRFLV